MRATAVHSSPARGSASVRVTPSLASDELDADVQERDNPEFDCEPVPVDLTGTGSTLDSEKRLQQDIVGPPTRPVARIALLHPPRASTGMTRMTT